MSDTRRTNLVGLRRRVEFIRDNAEPRADMTDFEKGQIVGARNLCKVMLAMLEDVRCDCEVCEGALPERAAVLRLVHGDRE